MVYGLCLLDFDIFSESWCFFLGLFVCFLYQLQVSVSISVSLVDIKSKRLLLNYTQSHICCQPGKVEKSEPHFFSACWVLLTFLPGSTVSRDQLKQPRKRKDSSSLPLLFAWEMKKHSCPLLLIYITSSILGHQHRPCNSPRLSWSVHNSPPHPFPHCLKPPGTFTNHFELIL